MNIYFAWDQPDEAHTCWAQDKSLHRPGGVPAWVAGSEKFGYCCKKI